MSQNIPCAGFVVFSEDCIRTVLVATPRGNLSFPKGKRKKFETDLQTALRELEEETGLTENDIIRIGDEYVDEKSNKGNVNVRYFICRIKNDDFEFKIEDPEELTSVQWYNIMDVDKSSNLKDTRKTVLFEASKIVANR